ncbi:biofilm-specific peroxidase; 2-cys peroxiredoxin [Candidatus Hydrogenisulfobacillus filiaventi]|uniref:Biofilm-specific peroxidase 2-cys peroxiredoxin n=1 Tax=Candidatus Hydrogenisulfobacillus filiaventi TaxID=2707344 RepID=A0A6F8ZD46_9FIRM|nr:peroxiredoxin [Bacillota bacterium]CAB1127687.1 biofilm-specific peroxidase; 2-cys peroxiredoxin [Candidatus Hydrogenisulfobacillus filiaventi]
MALVGTRAPDFRMPAVVEGEIRDITLNGYRGRWLALFFYPHDFTFVCPTEITAMSRRLEDFERRGCSIVGVSTDSPYVHRAWIDAPVEAGGLGAVRYPLASDWTHEVSRAYQVYVPEEGAAYRGLFLIDPEGIVQYEVVHNLNVGRSVDEVLRVLQALQTGGLCPVDWTPGQPLLTPH